MEGLKHIAYLVLGVISAVVIAYVQLKQRRMFYEQQQLDKRNPRQQDIDKLKDEIARGDYDERKEG